MFIHPQFNPVYVGSWANKPAANAVATGAFILINAALAAGGQAQSIWYSNGTNWKPLFPVVAGRKVGITSGAIQTADQVIGQIGPFPAGLFVDQTFRILTTLGRNNTTDAYGSSTTRWRLGTAGTTADSTLGLGNLSATFPAASGALSAGLESWLRADSDTTILRLGTGSWAIASWTSNSAVAMHASNTVGSLAAGAMYLSVTTTMAAATTTTPQTGLIELAIMPGE